MEKMEVDETVVDLSVRYMNFLIYLIGDFKLRKIIAVVVNQEI